MSESTGKPTALVLAGGGSLGAVQVGMLRALVAHGILPDLVVGSSVGAINGAYFAGTPNAEGVAELAAIWRGLRRSGVFPVTWRSLFGLLAHRGSVVDPGGLRRLTEQRLPYRTLEQTAVPLHLVATDLLGGGAVRLSSGPVVDAVLASCAIPGAFPPVRIGERHLIDGAVAANTPISVAIGLGAKRVIVLPTGFACALETPPRGAIATALHALTLLISHQLVVELERCRDQAEIITVPPLCPLAVSPYDFSRAREMIDRAAAQTDRWLDRGGLTRERVPPALQAHTHAGSGNSESETACELEPDERDAMPARAVIRADAGNAPEMLGRLVDLRASLSRGRVSAQHYRPEPKKRIRPQSLLSPKERAHR